MIFNGFAAYALNNICHIRRYSGPKCSTYIIQVKLIFKNLYCFAFAENTKMGCILSRRESPKIGKNLRSKIKELIKRQNCLVRTVDKNGENTPIHV